MMSLAVGDAGLRVVERIEPRHFVETARAAGVPARVLRSLFSELIEIRARAFETVREGLPDDFPQAMEVAIFDAITARLLAATRYLEG